jgi:hypothetical protein
VYEDLRQIANLRFSKVAEQISQDTQTELAKSTMAAAANGTVLSGPFEQKQLGTRLRATEQMCRALCDIWLELITRRNGAISREDVNFIMDKVGVFARAQMEHLRNLPPSKLGQPVTDVLLEKAQHGIASVVGNAHRDLEIRLLEQDAFPEKAEAATAAAVQQSIQVNIQNSTVANLNLGSQLNTINAALETITKDDHSEIAAALKQITEAVVASAGLVDPAKKEAIDALSALVVQAEALPEDRSTGTVKALVTWLPSIIGTAADLTTLWDRVGPIIKAHFSI